MDLEHTDTLRNVADTRGMKTNPDPDVFVSNFIYIFTCFKFYLYSVVITVDFT